MNFTDLKFVSLPLEQKQTKLQKTIDKRYVIGCDPLDQEDGVNIFHIYDKANLSYTTRVRTKKSFEEFVEWYSKKTSDIKVTYLTSTKFVTTDGKPKSPEQIRVEFQSSQGHINTI